LQQTEFRSNERQVSARHRDLELSLTSRQAELTRAQDDAQRAMDEAVALQAKEAAAKTIEDERIKAEWDRLHAAQRSLAEREASVEVCS
jgi:hypothetical protein